MILDIRKPRCAICGFIVDSCTVEQDFRVDIYRITVRCHGARDVVEIPREGTTEIALRQAFVPPPMLTARAL